MALMKLSVQVFCLKKGQYGQKGTYDWALLLGLEKGQYGQKGTYDRALMLDLEKGHYG